MKLKSEKGIFDSKIIKEIVNIRAMELMRGNEYTKKFQEDVEKIRKKIYT